MTDTFTHPPGLGAVVFHPQRLSPQAYDEFAHSKIRCCVDIIAYSRWSKNLLLAMRSIPPMNDSPWFFGGERPVGESRLETAMRHFNAATGVEPGAAAFTHILSPEYHWHGDKGRPSRHDETHLYAVGLDSEQVERLTRSLDPRGFVRGSLREYAWDDLQADNIHPVIRKAYRCLFPSP